MKTLRTALAQINTTVGALQANVEKIVEFSKRATQAGADLIVFPELTISGYPPEDLVLKSHFVKDCESQLRYLSESLPKESVIVIGCPRMLNGKIYNSALVFSGGIMSATYHKMILPNYSVFDEKRVFSAGKKPTIINLGPAQIGINICEDSWFIDQEPCSKLKQIQLDAIINLSASPYHKGKLDTRTNIISQLACSFGTTLLYCNLVGGQDELVFDGASMVLGHNGEIIAKAKRFEEDLLLTEIPVEENKWDFDSNIRREDFDWCFVDSGQPPHDDQPDPSFSPRIEADGGELQEVYSALTVGLRDYVEKNEFQKTVIALSGGIDSALVATLAVDALGADRVAAVSMPSHYSSEGTKNDAEALAHNLGIEFHVVPIQNLYDTYINELAPKWQGQEPDVTEENIQARIRGNIIMAFSNKFGWLVLTTGNKSELATGYCTLYGDMVGGFAVIKDVPKTLVFELSRWRNQQSTEPIIPPTIIERPPSAELRPDQKDSDSLPPYDLLDQILERYVEQDKGLTDILHDGFDEDLVKRTIRMVDRNEYKRRQGAPGIKITPKAFGRDRRMPITNVYRLNH